ncbi:ABC transporter ATP-binding protein [Rhizobium etli]|uniref:ABC transporter ATP-binding protein n=1 Tax=Rhizobium etli TaxID=29449 RepID=UPI000B1CB4AA|nr:ATP-binding cassette domain-containing protein [Rhizobium etli]
MIAEVNFEIAASKRALICGAAGSGKSTLLNAVAGLIPRLIPVPLFSGEITIKGTATSDLTRDQLFTSLSMVIQNVDDQLWDLNVEDLIAFPLENRGVDQFTVRKRLAEVITQTQIEHLRGRRVLTLSGGERRLVAIAAALSSAPDILVLDEPTTGLDPAARTRLVQLLQNAKVSALLVADQDPASLEGAYETIGLLNGGTLGDLAPAEKVLPLEALWLNAGVLPPARRRRDRMLPLPGDQLLEVSSLRTRLSRPDGRPVLNNVGFEIRSAETLALIGRNGAGKTTLFQAILGLARIEGGRIAIRGENADRWSPARRARSVAHLPQNMRRILFNMTALEEAVFAITASTATTKDHQVLAKADAVLEKYGLGALAKTNPFALSARQQALLGLACADAAGAPVAILDEPLLARDLDGRRMLDLFLETMREAGRAVMLISHDLELVADVAGRAMILDEGKISFDGPATDVWRSPAFRALGWRPPYNQPTGEAA